MYCSVEDTFMDVVSVRYKIVSSGVGACVNKNM